MVLLAQYGAMSTTGHGLLLCDTLGGLQSWAWGVWKEGQKKTVKAITAVALLHDCRVTLAGIIENYFHRGVAPLMATRLALFKMTVEAPSDGSRLSALPPSDAEIAHWLTEGMVVCKSADRAIAPYVFPILDYPLMRPEPGFVEFVSLFGSTLFPSSFFFYYFRTLQPCLPFSLAFFLDTAGWSCFPVEERGRAKNSACGWRSYGGTKKTRWRKNSGGSSVRYVGTTTPRLT